MRQLIVSQTIRTQQVCLRQQGNSGGAGQQRRGGEGSTCRHAAAATAASPYLVQAATHIANNCKQEGSSCRRT